MINRNLRNIIATLSVNCGGDRMHIQNWKKEILSIPNLLSLFRLALIPVYVVIYLNASTPEHYYLAGGILAVSCLTDLIDGKIARKFNMITKLGIFLDPVADKATQFTLTICLAIKYPVLWNLAIFFVLKEGFQLIAGFVMFHKGKMLKGALLPGKICTTVLFMSLIILVMYPGASKTFVDWVTVIDASFMMFSLITYILAYFGKNKNFQDIDN